MQDQPWLAVADWQLLIALGVRDGRASPAELREATGLPARTLTRALGRLDAAGLLAERSKRIVMLSSSAWTLVQEPTEPRRAVSGIDAPAVIRARAPSTEPAADDYDVLEDPDEELDVDEDKPPYDDEPDEPPGGGGFWAGVRGSLR